jgi:hypothetical protein
MNTPSKTVASDRFFRVASAFLFIFAAITIAHDLVRLWHSDGRDLLWRWREERYLLQRQNPFDVVDRQLDELHGLPPRHIARNNRLDPRIGLPTPGGYPPWALLTNFAFVYPGSIRIGIVYIDLLNLASIAITAAWAYWLARSYGRDRAVFLAAAVLAMFSNGSTIRIGQLGLIVNLALLGLWLADEAGWPICAGICLVVAASKPTISWLFALRPVVRRWWVSLAFAAALLAGESCVIWAITRTNPLEMMSQNLHQSQEFAALGFGPLTILLALGAPKALTTASLMIVSLGAAALIAFRLREAPPLVFFACAALIGRLCTYHHQYDDVMLVFALVHLGLLWFKKPTWMIGLAFWSLGLTVWAPLRYSDYTLAVQAVISVIWVYGLFVTLIEPESAGVGGLDKVHNAF